jgi:hypothetical protein
MPTTLSWRIFEAKAEFKCRPSFLASAKRLRSKLNHAVEATDVKLAASKTALGLHSLFTFSENPVADNENVFTFFVQRVKKLSLRF